MCFSNAPGKASTRRKKRSHDGGCMAFKLFQDKSDSGDYPNSYYHASQNV